MVAANRLSTPAQAGAAFNNVTRQLRGGLWQNSAEDQALDLGSAIVADRQTVMNGVNRGRQAA
jgi:hypothetical protein